MSGTKSGGKLARATNLANDPNYYAKIGRLGGQARVAKGFSLMDKDKHKAASSKGGQNRKIS